MKHLKSFLENQSSFYTEISDDEFRNKTCRSIGGEEYDDPKIFRKEELMDYNDVMVLNKTMEENKDKIEEYKYIKYKPFKDKNSRAIRPEYSDYFYLKVKYIGDEYLITKRIDEWFYVLYMRDRTKKHWECDQLEGVIQLLKDSQVIK
jgi:hypothetical protein